MSYIEKERLIRADIESIENRVRHAFNQGYDLGYKEGKERAKPQEPRKGHWINKQRLSINSCSAECSSCHKRSNGYVYDNGFSLVCTYYDFCHNCGSDNREVEE